MVYYDKLGLFSSDIISFSYPFKKDIKSREAQPFPIRAGGKRGMGFRITRTGYILACLIPAPGIKITDIYKQELCENSLLCFLSFLRKSMFQLHLLMVNIIGLGLFWHSCDIFLAKFLWDTVCFWYNF